MPGLKKAVILAYQHLKSSLEPCGYSPIPGTIGTQRHDKRPTKFCLCVDDFRVKYWSKTDVDHFCNAVGATFRYTVDMNRSNYCGPTLDWNYKMGFLNTKIVKYMPAILKKLNHLLKVIPQH